MAKKKICWVTADYFTDSDLQYDILDGLCKTFSIDWYILEGKTPYFTRDMYRHVESIKDLRIHFLVNHYRTRDPRSVMFYLKLYKLIKRTKADLIYYNVAPNPASALIIHLMDKKKLICTAHDGKAQNDSSKFGAIRTWSYNAIYKHVDHINMFSEAQAELMQKTYGPKDVHIMRLALKNMGNAPDNKPHDYVRFLSFGHIIYQKNIDLLIEAGNILYERGYHNFRISINGTCDNWDFYQDKIAHKEIFECNPNFITNDELLELFGSSNFAVFPYRRVSQSGVLKLAFNYNLPVIVSNIGSFKEEVAEGTNGFFFEVGNAENLADVMERCLNMFPEEYKYLCDKMRDYIKENYSSESIVRSYTSLFNSL